MRQIEFRGLDSNGVWHYGNLLQSKPFKNGRIDCWIQPKTLLTLGAVSTPTSAFVKVIEKTVGQFIGLKDKNGVENYEGDVIQYWELYERHSDAVDYFDVEPQNNFSVDEVFFELKTGVVELVDGAFKVNGTYIFDIAEHNKDRIIDNHYQGSLGLPLKDFIYDCYERGITKPLSKGLGAIKIIGNRHQNPELLEQ